MTEEQKPERRKPGPKPSTRKPRATPANNKTSAGQTITDARSNRKSKYGDDVRAAAKALYEGDPAITKRQVAEEMGIPYATLDKWSKGGDTGTDDKWVKRTAENMSERAKAAADTYRGKLSELGPEITTEQQKQAMDEAADETAVELRAKVLERHRKEWNVPRGLVNEAVKARDFNKAKLAKITSETLKLIQDGERKAWGIDSGPDGATKVQVVIERE